MPLTLKKKDVKEIFDTITNKDERYKIVEIPYSKNISNELRLLNRYFSSNSNNDIIINYVHGKIILKLACIDINFVRKTGYKLYNNDPDLSERQDIIVTILNGINNIKNYGIKGGRRVYVGYNKERKVQNRIQKFLKRKTYYYASNDGFSSHNNLPPSEYINTILCEDSEHYLKNLPDNCIDIILTSPPYNFGLDYTDQNDDHFWGDYFNKLFKILNECIRVLKYGGRLIINVQPLFSDYIPTHHIISNHLMSKRLIWKGEVLWEKNNYNCKYTAWGSWKSPSNPYLKYTWEFIEIFSKGALRKPGEKTNIDIQAEEFKKWVVAKWSLAPERKMKQFQHPAMFPEELVERCLKLFSYKGDLVLDPFNGAGTTTFVAHRLSRKYIGIDISPEYCKIAKDRIGGLF